MNVPCSHTWIVDDELKITYCPKCHMTVTNDFDSPGDNDPRAICTSPTAVITNVLNPEEE